ncbi:MAG: helix-turn-helix domain-containing protein [Oscillospiraceae bacterium]|nr:helix-turn-helix domain-containing protein [Oscillospiraceae bacterium]
MKENTKLGQVIYDLRIRHSMKGQALAEKVGISRSYLCQLEHGVRLNPDPAVIMKISKVLDLTDDEASELFDMYAKETGQLAPDIVEYIRSNKMVQKALRCACNKGVPDEVWGQFIEQLNK